MTNHSMPRPTPARDVSVLVRRPIGAPPANVFPLCCPIEEYRWIPGWTCQIVHCPNQRVELGTVFREMFSAPFLLRRPWGKTTWTAVLHDPEQHRVHFELTNARSSSRYEIEMADGGHGGTIATLHLHYHALDRAGERLVERGGQTRIEVMLDLLGLMLKTYSETGRKVRRSVLERAISTDVRLSRIDKIHLVLNGLLVRLAPRS